MVEGKLRILLSPVEAHATLQTLNDGVLLIQAQMLQAANTNTIPMQCRCQSPTNSKLPTLSNLTNIKNTFLCNPTGFQRLSQYLRRLQDILLRQYPGAPMNPHRPLTPRILEDIHAIEWIRVHRTHDIPWIVCANGYQTEVEGPAKFPDLRKGRAMR